MLGRSIVDINVAASFQSLKRIGSAVYRLIVIVSNDFRIVWFDQESFKKSGTHSKHQAVTDLTDTDSLLILSSFPKQGRQDKQDVMFLYSQIVKGNFTSRVYTRKIVREI